MASGTFLPNYRLFLANGIPRLSIFEIDRFTHMLPLIPVVVKLLAFLNFNLKTAPITHILAPISNVNEHV